MKPSIVVLSFMLVAAARDGEAANRPCSALRASTHALTRIRAGSDVVFDTGLVVTPFAVPVAVPVAVISRPAVFYAYSQYAGSPPCEPPKPAPTVAAAQPPSIIARACLACHGDDRPQAGLSLASLSSLSPEQRLEAIARVVSDDPRQRMPKGAVLSAREIGQLLQELSAH